MTNYVTLFLIHGLTSSQISNDDIHQYLVQLHYMQMLPISIDSVGSNLKYVHVTGSLYSVDWTTGLDYWTGILDSPLTPKIAYKRLHLAPYSLVGRVGL